jgi:hypothetical protein
MFKLNIDLTTFNERKPFDPENIEETIGIIEFDDFIPFIAYVMAELNPSDKKVYILAYGEDEDEDGFVFVDHMTCNIIDLIESQVKDLIDEGCINNVFLFARDNYNDAYDLALDMKEQTGMLKWQLEMVIEMDEPTISNKGVRVDLSVN